MSDQENRTRVEVRRWITESATKSDIKLLNSRITALDSRIVMLMWIVGINLTLLFGMGGPLLWLMLRIAAKVGAL